ncbi:MAG: Rid family detoxifying hydrolase [Candidatus Bathyarchaeia archaeon]
MKQLVRTPNAPQPLGPYSQGVKAGNLLFVAGQGAADPKTGQMAEGIETQTRQTLANIKGIVEASGFSMRDVVKVSIFLKNMDDFKKANEVYKTFFPEDPPARTTVEAKLPAQGMLIEIEAIAYRE